MHALKDNEIQVGSVKGLEISRYFRLDWLLPRPVNVKVQTCISLRILFFTFSLFFTFVKSCNILCGTQECAQQLKSPT